MEEALSAGGLPEVLYARHVRQHPSTLHHLPEPPGVEEALSAGGLPEVLYARHVRQLTGDVGLHDHAVAQRETLPVHVHSAGDRSGHMLADGQRQVRSGQKITSGKKRVSIKYQPLCSCLKTYTDKRHLLIDVPLFPRSPDPCN